VSLHVERMQVRVGGPDDGPPTGFGYWLAASYERYACWPFASAAARAQYEEGAGRLLDMAGLVRSRETTLQVAALVVLSLEGDLEADVATHHLTRLGLTRHLQDDLRTIAYHCMT
jgi:hypothetical protein